MRIGSALSAVVIVAVVCIAYVALSPITDDPVVPDGGQDGGADQGQGDDGLDPMTSVLMTAGGRTFTIVLEDNETAASFVGMLPMTVSLSELNGNEKYHYLPEQLPRDDIKPGTIHAGDVMLYGGDCLVVFYETFRTSYGYTPVGHISDTEGLAEALGDGSVEVSFSLSQTPSAHPAERIVGIQGRAALWTEPSLDTGILGIPVLPEAESEYPGEEQEERQEREAEVEPQHRYRHRRGRHADQYPARVAPQKTHGHSLLPQTPQNVSPGDSGAPQLAQYPLPIPVMTSGSMFRGASLSDMGAGMSDATSSTGAEPLRDSTIAPPAMTNIPANTMTMPMGP